MSENPASSRTNSCKRVHLLEFERRVHQYQDRIYGFACYMLGNNEDAGDVTQDVLIRLWRQRDTVDEKKILPWLMRVTRNACIDVIRHRRTVRTVVDDGAEIDRVPYEDGSPASQLERRDDRRMIEEALAEVREPYRSVVILREIQNLKYEEISGAMDMPLNTVKVYVHRGRKMLREKLIEVMEREGV